MGIDVEVGASLTVGDLDKAMANLRKDSGAAKFQILHGSAAVIGDGVNIPTFPIICNGSPNGPGAGYIWALDSITTFSQDDHTLYNPTPGTSYVGAVYIGGSSGNVSLAELAFPGFTFPSVFDLSDGLYVQHGESIIIKASAVLAAGQQIGANIWGRQYRITDLLELSGR